MNGNQNNKILYGIGGIVIGLIIAGIFYPMMRYGGYGMMNWGYNSRSDQGINGNNQVASTIDKHFIEQMIPHHEGAIAMAQLALQKAKRPEVRSLATGIIDAQQAEISEMRKWYQDWFDTSVSQTNQHMMSSGPMGGSMHMNGMSGDMKALESAQDFDLEFVKQMIPHHEMAVVMAQMLKSNTSRAEMKQLADNIITSQTKEIEMMRSWVQAWTAQ